jgi:D-alanyl-D-alanine carboxypeptidase (penicillin-binding protein 5/6)
VEVGVLKIWSDERLIQETPLHTGSAVQRGTFHSRAFDALSELLFGWL